MAIGKYTSVSADWTEPKATCSSSQPQGSSFWVGLDGWLASSQTVEQTGTQADCFGGTPYYYSWYEMWPSNATFFTDTVKAGDKFYGSVTWSSGSSYTLVLKDLTQGWAHTVSASVSGAANSSAEVITEAPSATNGAIAPLTNYSAASFSNVTANGTPLSANATAQGLIMLNASDHEMAGPSGWNQENFTDNWFQSGD